MPLGTLEVDGILGPSTISALQGFLQLLGVYGGEMDGIIDGLPAQVGPSETVRALQRLLNKGVSTVTVTAINLD